MFKKILFADDLSRRVEKILPVMLDLVRRYGAELMILNVREDFLNKDEMVMLRVDVSRFQDDIKEKALAIRNSIEADVRSGGGADLPYTIKIQEGKPAREIIATAKEWGADLIVVGSRGASPLKDKLFGTVTLEIVKKAGRSVLVLHADEAS
jgi:nucleotide-binding universal stress UspA family protein